MRSKWRMNLMLVVFLFFLLHWSCLASDEIPQWSRFEKTFTSAREYANVLYDVKKFAVRFVSPTGRIKTINGFWDGALQWKVRFSPDEKGAWTWESFCSDSVNSGLHGLKGQISCIPNSSQLDIYKHGAVVREKSSYHLSHADGSPFFWAACTAWNGTLKSTEKEWDQYLTNRSQTGYNVIQFVTTQWRGSDKNSQGQVAFEGSGRITINPGFFRHLDGKIDEINKHGLVAAPVLLWALGSVQGRELSPGYYLPEHEAILLARYMVARYGGNHVIWILGGDGKYTEENEQRWKNIGRGVFREEHPGPVSLHPGGGSWIGEAYASEDWLDIIGYQSGHNNGPNAINFMTRGPISRMWHRLPPRVLINMEPVYEEIAPDITDRDIRNAGYWSVLNAPAAGITYGANGLWPWLRDGEEILNHAGKGEKSSRWYKAILLPGSLQTGYLANFMRSIEWWKLRPAQELLTEQPGEQQPGNFVSVAQSNDRKLIVVYIPKSTPIKLLNLHNKEYNVQWFNPSTNKLTNGRIIRKNNLLEISPPENTDMILLLKSQGQVK
ncbi:apiosidase-like domain-containing protein [Flavitalea antarctica]